MSELIQRHDNRAIIRWKLLTSVSAAALLISVYAAGEAQAADNDADRPPLWIELGGQLEGLNSPQKPFLPPFTSTYTQYGIASPLRVEGSPHYGLGLDGKISFQPGSSDWVFSASLLYGRYGSARHEHQQTRNKPIPFNVNLGAFGYPSKYVARGSYYPNNHRKFADAFAKQSETHTVLDFQAGKDVGLGLFGSQGSSVVSAGVRFAQFSSKASVSLVAVPDLQYPTTPVSSLPALIAWDNNNNGYPNGFVNIHFHNYTGLETNQRSFRGMGPSLSWNASAPFAGNAERGEITLDWGANAAILFGRQKARGQHQTGVKSYFYNQFHKKDNGCVPAQPCQKTGHFLNYANYEAHGGGQNAYYTHLPTAQHTNAASFNRMRSVIVPNFGAFAGLSLNWPNAKISLGYRADFFFGAIDGGIDTRKEENRGFFGPFASISVGLGD